MLCIRSGLCALAVVAALHCAQAQEARRIVSIGGDVTETLYALGLADAIVAIDTTSQFPPEALQTKPNVGYLRALSPEGVVSVGGTLVIASDKAGPPDVVKTLKGSLPYAEIAEGTHPETVPEKIRAIAKIVGKRDEGEALAAQVERDLQSLAEERKRIQQPPLRTLFVLNMQGGRLVVAGSETNAAAMLRLSHLTNVAADLKGYKPIGDEALFAMAPELVLVMKTGGHEAGAAMQSAGLAATPAGKSKRIVYVDAGSLLSFGPRVAQQARSLMRASYPNQ